MSSALASLCAVMAILAAVYLWTRPRELRSSNRLLRTIPLLVLFGFLSALFVWGIQYRQAELRGRSPAAAESNASELEIQSQAPGPHEHAGGDENPPVSQSTGTSPEVAPQAPASPDAAEPSAGEAPPKSTTPTRGLSPPAAAAPAVAGLPENAEGAVDGKFSVVPVFFGTDRAETAGAKHLDFGAERGRRLELGRALVSVPTSHEVPKIERPWSLRIPYFDVKIYEETEDPAKHFMLRDIRKLSRQELIDLVAVQLAKSQMFKDHALVFVHGFNTSFDNAVYRSAQITHDLRFDGASFMYSWPSGGAVASYTYDRESAGQSQPFMRDFLQLVVKETKARAVSVVAHSMGNQPLLQVLKDLKQMSPGIAINQVILAAPDVDRDQFENLAREIKGFAKGITLYAASNDRALNVSRRFHGGVARAGDVPPSGPVVTEGVDTIDVTAISTDSLGLNHSSYAENNTLLNDIGLLLRTGERPPDKRVPILARISTPAGDYWRYPGR